MDRNEEINQTTFMRNQNRKKKEKERVGREKSKNLWWCISTNSVEKGGIYVAAAVALEWNIYV